MREQQEARLRNLIDFCNKVVVFQASAHDDAAVMQFAKTIHSEWDELRKQFSDNEEKEFSIKFNKCEAQLDAYLENIRQGANLFLVLLFEALRELQSAYASSLEDSNAEVEGKTEQEDQGGTLQKTQFSEISDFSKDHSKLRRFPAFIANQRQFNVAKEMRSARLKNKLLEIDQKLKKATTNKDKEKYSAKKRMLKEKYKILDALALEYHETENGNFLKKVRESNKGDNKWKDYVLEQRRSLIFSDEKYSFHKNVQMLIDDIKEMLHQNKIKRQSTAVSVKLSLSLLFYMLNLAAIVGLQFRVSELRDQSRDLEHQLLYSEPATDYGHLYGCEVDVLFSGSSCTPSNICPDNGGKFSDDVLKRCRSLASQYLSLSRNADGLQLGLTIWLAVIGILPMIFLFFKFRQDGSNGYTRFFAREDDPKIKILSDTQRNRLQEINNGNRGCLSEFEGDEGEEKTIPELLTKLEKLYADTPSNADELVKECDARLKIIKLKLKAQPDGTKHETNSPSCLEGCDEKQVWELYDREIFKGKVKSKLLMFSRAGDQQGNKDAAEDEAIIIEVEEFDVHGGSEGEAMVEQTEERTPLLGTHAA